MPIDYVCQGCCAVGIRLNWQDGKLVCYRCCKSSNMPFKPAFDGVSFDDWLELPMGLLICPMFYSPVL